MRPEQETAIGANRTVNAYFQRKLDHIAFFIYNLFCPIIVGLYIFCVYHLYFITMIDSRILNYIHLLQKNGKK